MVSRCGAVVVVKLQRGQDFADEEAAAPARVDEHGVLADEAQAGLLRVAALQDSAGVDIDLLRRRAASSASASQSAKSASLKPSTR